MLKIIKNTKYRNILIITASFLFIIFYPSFLTYFDTGVEKSEKQTENVINTKDNPTEITPMVYVYLEGAIKNPGVYEMGENDRLFSVIEKSGGYQDANEKCLNLSEKLVDQEAIYVPYKNEECLDATTSHSLIKESDSNSEDNGKSGVAQGNTDGKININTSTKEELQKLSGIGEKKAEDIIKYREDSGKFNSIEEIVNVQGIGRGTYEKIQDEITI